MKRIIITGANQGLGFETARILAQKLQEGDDLVLTGRSQAIVGAVQKINAEMGREACRSVMLDVNDSNSIQKAIHEIAKSGPIDVLINNAGIAFKGDDKQSKGDQVKKTNATNYWGLKQVMDTALPLMSANGRVINVASQMGQRQLESSLSSKTKELGRMSVAELDAFVKQQEEAKNVEGLNAYGLSKAYVIALTHICAAIKLQPYHGKTFLAMCPRHCSSRMGGEDAPRTPQQGGHDIADLVDETKFPHVQVNGQFFVSGKIVPSLLE